MTRRDQPTSPFVRIPDRRKPSRRLPAETVRLEEETPAPRSRRRERVRPVAPRPAYRPQTLLLPVEPEAERRRALEPVYKKPPRQRPARPKPAPRQKRRQQYDLTLSLGRAEVHAPALSLPRFGPRWLSGLLTLGLVFLLYTMWTSAMFTVSGVQIRGNQRLGAAEIEAAVRMTGQPIFLAVPERIETILRATYLDLEAVEVHVGFPNQIVIEVAERTPVIAWYQGEALAWLDRNGVAFPPRGSAEGLLVVTASGSPPPVAIGMDTPPYERPYLAPEIVQAMLTLAPYLPAGAPMIYDPRYGIGWQDGRGWMVYFGPDTQDIAAKLQVYQTVVETLSAQGIRPSLISMEYLHAPYYK
ncbi:MAG: FtsQ-type POTRA domain-containing protein [Anaerolineales bacterium]